MRNLQPYFFTLIMFIGEALCLVWYYLDQWYTRWQAKRSGRGYVSVSEDSPMINGAEGTSSDYYMNTFHMTSASGDDL